MHQRLRRHSRRIPESESCIHKSLLAYIDHDWLQGFDHSGTQRETQQNQAVSAGAWHIPTCQYDSDLEAQSMLMGSVLVTVSSSGSPLNQHCRLPPCDEVPLVRTKA